MSKRHRRPTAGPNELKIGYGREDRYAQLDIVYVWGDGVSRASVSLVDTAFKQTIHEGRNLYQELEARGFDLTTLRFSIRKKTPEPPTT